MILFKDRMKTLRDTCLEYIQNKMDEKSWYIFENEGEVLVMSDKYKYREEDAKTNDLPLWKELDVLSTEKLIEIADNISLYPVKKEKVGR